MGLNLQQGEVHRGKLKVTTLSALIHYFHEKWAPKLSNYLFQGRTIYIRAYDRWWKWTWITWNILGSNTERRKNSWFFWILGERFFLFIYTSAMGHLLTMAKTFNNILKTRRKKSKQGCICMCTWTIVKLQSLASLYWGKLVSVEITWVTRSLM